MDYQEIYERLFIASKTAGIVADMMQATIINEGKQVETVDGEDERHKRMREAKTRADEIVQEILLQALLPEYQDVLPGNRIFSKTGYYVYVCGGHRKQSISSAEAMQG